MAKQHTNYKVIMADHIYNTEYALNEFTYGGEVQLMDRLAKHELNMIFDVGSNIGEWTRMARQRQPNASIHTFECMPVVYRNLLNNNVLDGKVTPNQFGLSDSMGTIDMLYDEDNDRLTTPCLELARVHPKVVPLMMVDGDTYCKCNSIEAIDFLKIDTEGHEFKVLKGLDGLIQNTAITIIQFEYGYANVLTKDLLIDFYRYLQPLGYALGKLTPEGVGFKDYGLFDEDFRGPNYVAVHQSRPDIMADITI